MKKEINCTFAMSGTYSLESASVYDAWLEAQGNLPLPAQREYVSDSLEVESLDQCMVANGWEEDEVERLSCMTEDELTREIFRREDADLGISESWKAETKRMKEFLLDYYGTPYAPPKPHQPQPEQASPERDVYAVLRNRNRDMDIKVYESIDDAKEYVKTDLQAEKDSLSKKGIEPDIISSDELLFTQLMDQDSNHLVYWKIIQTGLIPKTTPNIPSSAPQPVAVEQNKPPVVPTDIRIETSKGALIAREDLLSHGVWIDLRRPDANDDLPLAFVGPSFDEDGVCDGRIKVKISGDGMKSQKSKTVLIDGIEMYFLRIDRAAGKHESSKLSILTSLGRIVATPDVSGIFIRLQRPDSTQELPLAYICCKDQSVWIRVDREGQKDFKDKFFTFDGVEDYFRTDDDGDSPSTVSELTLTE